MSSPHSMSKSIVLPLVVLIAFTLGSLWLVVGEPPLGFLTLARDEPWGLQVLLDLVIACSLFLTWMTRDARARGLPVLPYYLLVATLGSIGALAYLVHRGVRAGAATAA